MHLAFKAFNHFSVLHHFSCHIIGCIDWIIYYSVDTLITLINYNVVKLAISCTLVTFRVSQTAYKYH